jgi:hypothetical protein
LENSRSESTDVAVIARYFLQLLLVCHRVFFNFSPVFYGIISNWAGLPWMELGLKVLSVAGRNDEFKGMLAVVTELTFVLLGLLAVALRLHVYGIIVRKGLKSAKIEIIRPQKLLG